VANEEGPLAQFEIHKIIPMHIGGHDVSFTNSSFFMMGVLLLISLFMIGGMRRAAIVPGRWQLMVEAAYEFVANMVTDTAGQEARKYFPFIFTIFMFVLFANVIGIIPYTFTVTSHIIITFAMAAVVFLGVTVIGFIKHGAHFLKFFVPSGVPAVMLLILVPIEVISYLTRPVSLSVRLFANMMAGHTILKVFGGFVVALGVFGVVPLLFISALTGLELLVAALQAYVFAVLTCIYLNDALHMH
jgi:F-type H+-transporting ATPase subunit a